MEVSEASSLVHLVVLAAHDSPELLCKLAAEKIPTDMMRLIMDSRLPANVRAELLFA